MSLTIDHRCIRLGRFELWPGRRLLLREGRPCVIGGRAFDLLLVLLEHRERVVGVQDLMRLVWPGLAVEPNNVQVQIWALRKLLGRHAIATVPRRGYRLVAPVFTATSVPAVPVHVPTLVAPGPARPALAAPAAAGSRSRLRWNPRSV